MRGDGLIADLWLIDIVNRQLVKIIMLLHRAANIDTGKQRKYFYDQHSSRIYKVATTPPPG